MKKNYTFILACLLSINAFVSKAQAPVPDLIHYKFNGTGTSVTNYASTPPVGAATATLMGAITQTGAIGCIGAGVGSGVSASTDYVNTGWVTNFPAAAWSISFWTSNVQPSATLYYIFGDASAGSFRCFTNGVAGPNNWILRGTGITDVLITGAATTTPNMVSFVYNQTTSNIIGYINGVSTVTVAQAGVPTVSSTTGPFKVIGYGTNVGMNAGGLLGDFRVYGSALTSTDVLNIYNSTIAQPTAVVSGTNSICLNQSTTLFASGADSYTWSTASNSSSIVVTPTATSIYTLTGSSGTCVSQPALYTVTISSPTITVNSATICSGQSFTMNPSGAISYTYSSGSAIVTPSTSANYTVTGSDALSCTNTAISSVSVNPNPTVAAVSNASLICVGQTASLTANGATTYLWNTSSTNTVLAVTPSVTTSYTVTGTTNGCSATFTISQAVSPCTGINNNVAASSNVKLYPNPNTGEFTLELINGSTKTIELMDVTGRVILSETTSNDKIDVNITTLSNGIYYVRIQSNNAVEVIKIVKE
ncbi:MAG: T9SS type A sorting domain-containing protein [Bacteroidota bacterium]|nr:T9SS type A sorting domain-containing protein [Bacteroidota bacterium]